MPTKYQQSISFKPKPEQILEEFQFTGGLITDVHETKLQPTQSPDLANVVFNTTGSIKTRNGYLRYNSDEVGSASDTANTGAKAGTLAISTYQTYVSQTFVPSGTVSVPHINVYLAMHTSGQEQLCRLELWTTSASAPSALLAQSQIKLITGTSEATYTFRFLEPVALTAATTYAIVLRPHISGSSVSVNQIDVSHRGTTYASGQVYTSADAGLTWTGDSAKDLRFDVWSGGATGCTGLIRYYNSTGVSQMFGKFGASLYLGNDNTGVLTAITLGSGVSLTSANFIDTTIFNDTLLVVDGTNKIQKYRGSTNSNYSTGTITATNGSATIAGSSTVWNTTTNAVVGEYIQLPDTKWYKITAIASDTSLTIEVAYQGSTLSGQTYKISPWGEVQGKLNSSTAVASLTRPTGKFIASHINRVWVLQDNTLYGSTLDTSVTEECFNDFDTSNNSLQIIIPAGEGDTGRGLYSLNGYLYIFQRNAIWVLSGNSPANFELRNVSNEVGLVDKRTLVEYDAYLMFYSGKDVYIFDGSNLKNLTANRINSTITSFASLTSPVAVLWKSHYILSYTPSGGSYNSEAVFYDITNDIWGKFEQVFASAWVNWNGGSDTGQVYFGSSSKGTIYKWDTGGHDDGYEITTRYNTPSISLGNSARMNDKVVKRVYLQQLALGDWDLTINQYSDITSGTITSEINLASGTTSLWDVAQWDVDVWSDEGSLITTRINEFQGTAKYFKYEMEQTGYDEGVDILGLTVAMRTRRLN